MFSTLTDAFSNIGIWVRKGLGVVGGILVGFGLDVDVLGFQSNIDMILDAAKSLVTTVQGIAGSIAIVFSGLLSYFKTPKTPDAANLTYGRRE